MLFYKSIIFQMTFTIVMVMKNSMNQNSMPTHIFMDTKKALTWTPGVSPF